MRDHLDIVILGGGCAGLSLANNLAGFGKDAPSVLIIEQRKNYSNDKTWCFWDVEDPEHHSLATKAWSKFEITNHESHIYNCHQHQYLMLESDQFYQASLDKIKSNPKIQLMLGEKLSSPPIKTKHGWYIETASLGVSAKLVIDTRPPQKNDHNDSLLWQCFVGHEIETQHDSFSPERMTLMAFDHTFKNGLAFVYILPTTAKKALIEYTVFSEHIISKAQLNTFLKKAITKKIDHQPYQTLRIEHGTLPMGNKIRTQNKDPSYLYAGLFAGAARPSSGYAFQRIQSWAKKCALTIMKDNKLYPFPKDPFIQSLMDKLFLNVIKNNHHIAAKIFEDLFAQCHFKSVVNFMSDRASFWDCLHIIRSLPPWPFLKALPRFLIQNFLKIFRASS
jgi:lycopene beta-cyclase